MISCAPLSFKIAANRGRVLSRDSSIGRSLLIDGALAGHLPSQIEAHTCKLSKFQTHFANLHRLTPLLTTLADTFLLVTAPADSHS